MHTVQLKPTIKAQISGRMACIGISDDVTTSVYSEKTRQKKLTMIMIMNKLQETTVFHGRQKLVSAMKIRLRKVMLDFKFDALYIQVCIHREHPVVRRVKS